MTRLKVVLDYIPHPTGTQFLRSWQNFLVLVHVRFRGPFSGLWRRAGTWRRLVPSKLLVIIALLYSIIYQDSLRDFRNTPRCIWGLRSSGMLLGVGGQLTCEDGNDRLSRNVGNQLTVSVS